jgi:hypothetical protein
MNESQQESRAILTLKNIRPPDARTDEIRLETRDKTDYARRYLTFTFPLDSH